MGSTMPTDTEPTAPMPKQLESPSAVLLPDDEAIPALPDSETAFVDELEPRPASASDDNSNDASPAVMDSRQASSMSDDNSNDASSAAASSSLSLLPRAGAVAILTALYYAGF